MPTAEDIRRLQAYNRAVLEKYVRRLAKMPWSVVTKDRESGHRSMKDTVVHIVRVHDAWLNYVAKGRVRGLRAAWKRQGPFDSWERVRRYMGEGWLGGGEKPAGIARKALRRGGEGAG